ncbi:hypothetical protein AAHC03_01272 [Spirometra sp. Aus1]
MLSKDVYWLRSLVGVTGCISWLFACGSVAYALVVIASVEYAVVDLLESTEFKSGLLLLALSGAATMITGMIGSCGALQLAKSSLLLYSCVATIECLGFLAAGSLALHSRMGMEKDIHRKFDHLLASFDPTSTPLNAETQRLDGIQALLRCCGKNGKKDFDSAATPHSCIRMAFADQGCLRISMNWFTTGLFHQSVLGFVGAFLLLFSLFFSALLFCSLLGVLENSAI